MENNQVNEALDRLDTRAGKHNQPVTLAYAQFLEKLRAKPQLILRNIFQLFHDMIKAYVDRGDSVSLGDPDTVSLMDYDCSRLLVNGADNPFLADRIFANRLVSLAENLKRGAQQNLIYIFDGPPGCGKSTFLNNLLHKLEEYTSTDQGLRHEVVWQLDRQSLGNGSTYQTGPLLEKLHMLLAEAYPPEALPGPGEARGPGAPLAWGDDARGWRDSVVEVPCPSHDHPILLIPKGLRRQFLDDLLDDGEFKERLFGQKEYQWVFRENPCTICLSLYQALLAKLQSPRAVLAMAAARPYFFSRRLGQGISVFSPGDQTAKQPVIGDPGLERRINSLLGRSYYVHYQFSRYARTNNGVYALMDIKSNNTERLVELHNIVSEGVHKVDAREESVNSLFLAVMNPEDKENIKDIQSFLDRIHYVNIPYVLDFNTEVLIFLNIFGGHILERFLPRVLHNFARVIIATRLQEKSETMQAWLLDPGQYKLYCDENLQLLKMEIYAGLMPPWLSEEDVKRFQPRLRRKLWLESEGDGRQGLSGRDSIKIFSEFYSNYSREGKLINMTMLRSFFTKVRKDLLQYIPTGFLDALSSMYDYTVLQQVKEALYYYNETRISKDIQNYLFALNFEMGASAVCEYTGERIEVCEEFLREIEDKLLGAGVSDQRREEFRTETQREFTSRTLTQEIMMAGLAITATGLYGKLYERYVHNLKARVMDPFVQNQNFRRAIKDFGEEEFKTYDRKIRDDVTFMMRNLGHKFHYTPQGAKDICMDIIDRELVRRFDNA